jgi:hypothetical protein
MSDCSLVILWYYVVCGGSPFNGWCKFKFRFTSNPCSVLVSELQKYLLTVLDSSVNLVYALLLRGIRWNAEVLDRPWYSSSAFGEKFTYEILLILSVNQELNGDRNDAALEGGVFACVFVCAPCTYGRGVCLLDQWFLCREMPPMVVWCISIDEHRS